jgi:hypothetical protein
VSKAPIFPAFRGTGHIHGGTRHVLLGAPRPKRHPLHRVPVFIAGRELHVGVDRGRVLLQDGLDPALPLEDGPPVELGELAQTADGVRDRDPVLRLPLSILRHDVGQGLLQALLEPALHRHEHGVLVVEVSNQLHGEMCTRPGKGPHHFGQ